jgi:hypothetical protein
MKQTGSWVMGQGSRPHPHPFPPPSEGEGGVRGSRFVRNDLIVLNIGILELFRIWSFLTGCSAIDIGYCSAGNAG